MLHYAAVFFVIAVIAAIFGFTGIAVGAAEIAKVLFFVFLVLFVVSLIAGLFRRGHKCRRVPAASADAPRAEPRGEGKRPAMRGVLSSGARLGGRPGLPPSFGLGYSRADE